MDMNCDMPGMAGTTKTASTLGTITEYNLNWPGNTPGSTHELVINDRFVFVTGQKMNCVAKFDYQGKLLNHFKMPDGSNPHGILLDKGGQLWVSFEGFGTVVRLDQDTGHIEEEIDVKIHAKGAKTPINTAPHGIGLDADGATIWFTGKRTSTIGKINPDRSVQHFELGTLAALPIFLSAGADKGIWGTELLGNCILNISAEGMVKEYAIPTSNSRPIAVIPDPKNPCMWFTEEAGVKIGKIDMDGNITEYNIPAVQKNNILASLAFDHEGNLWVQAYVDFSNPTPQGYDYIIKFDKKITQLNGEDLSAVPFTRYMIPSRLSMMHRIRPDHNGNLWFTEMMTDKLGKITLNGK